VSPHRSRILHSVLVSIACSLLFPAFVFSQQLIFSLPVEPGAVSKDEGGVYYLGKMGDMSLIIAHQSKSQKLFALGGQMLGEYHADKVYYLVYGDRQAWMDELPVGAEILAEQGNLSLVVCSDHLPPMVHGRLVLLNVKPLPEHVPSPLLVEPLLYADPDIQELVDGVSEDNLYDTVWDLVSFGTRYSFTPECHMAAIYLATKFNSYGAVVEKQPFLPGSLEDIFFTEDGLNGWAVGRYGVILHTNDGGAVWEEQGNLAESNLKGVYFYDADHGWVCGLSGILIKTEDGGDNWVEVDCGFGNSFMDIWADENGLVLACGGWGIIIRSTNFGVTWSSYTISSEEFLWGIDMQEGGDRGVCVGNWGEAYLTNDGGQSWQKVQTGVSEYLRDVYFEEDGTCWVCGDFGTIIRSDDGGSSWSSVDGASQDTMYQIVLEDECGWVGGEVGTLWSTSDGGDHWETVQIETERSIKGLCQPHLNLAYLVGVQGIIFKYIGPNPEDWEDQSSHLSPDGTHTLYNVIGRIDGQLYPHQVYAISAHYDSIALGEGDDSYTYAPGADDNATGVSAVLETCRLLSDQEPAYTLQFICFSGEELGLLGSRHYAGNIKYTGDTFLAVLNFDMIGCTEGEGLNEDLELISNEQSVPFMDFIISSRNNYVPNLRINRRVEPDMVLSDHASFWGVGVPALLGIEDFPLSHNRGNTSKDTFEWVEFDYVALCTKGGVAALAELSQIGSLDLPAGLADLKVYPNPLNLATSVSRAFCFDGLPQDSKVRIYNIAGELVAELDPPTSGRTFWYARNQEGSLCSSGIYLYVVECSAGTTIGKLALVR